MKLIGISDLVILMVIAIIIVCFAIVIFFVIIFVKRRRSKNLTQQLIPPQDTTEHFVNPSKINADVSIKKCPTCHTTYTDKSLNYCLLDGDILKNATGSTADYDPDATIVR